MEISTNPEIKVHKFKKLKFIVIFFLLILLLGLGGYGYYRYDGVIKLQKEAQLYITKEAALEQASVKYDQLEGAVRKEYLRCQSFISQSEGNFGNFEYCKNYIQWASDLHLLKL